MEKIRVAELNVKIDYKYETLIKQAEAYKFEFEDKDTDIIISIPETYIEKIKNENPNLTKNDWEYILTGAVFYRELLKHNGFMLHSSTVVVDNEAYLFSAPSGTGKSTHTQLWLKEFGERAYILNDDKPAIRYMENKFYAYGTPWSGKTDWNKNEKVLIKGITFLERAEKNNIKKIESKEALSLLLYQGYRTRNSKETVEFLNVIDSLIEKINVYKLECNISREAVLTAYKGMNEEERKNEN